MNSPSHPRSHIPTVIISYDTLLRIEPLTVYSRHPFAFSQCGAVDVDAIWRKKAPRYNGPVTVFSVDHILTTTSQDFYRQTDKGKGSKILVFDAGSSVFASSGSWLTCAYAQSGMFPDGVFSWERDYIDPTHYLDQIPPPMRPRVHFANVPVIAGVETGMISPRVKIDGKVYIQHAFSLSTSSLPCLQSYIHLHYLSCSTTYFLFMPLTLYFFLPCHY